MPKLKSPLHNAKQILHKARLTPAHLGEIVNKTKSKAEEYLGNPRKARRLLEQAYEKLAEYGEVNGPLAKVQKDLAVILRLFRAYVRGEYRAISWSGIVTATVALIYLVAPIDLIPDFIAGLGLLDDVAIVAFVVKQIKPELAAFLQWEKAQTA